MNAPDFAEKGMRYLKKIILFCFIYIITFTIAMIVIFCVKGEYPETLSTLTFAFFSIEVVVSAAIKIFESVKAKFERVKNGYNDYFTGGFGPAGYDYNGSDNTLDPQQNDSGAAGDDTSLR